MMSWCKFPKPAMGDSTVHPVSVVAVVSERQGGFKLKPVVLPCTVTKPREWDERLPLMSILPV